MKLRPTINIGKANKKDKNLCVENCSFLEVVGGTCFLFIKSFDQLSGYSKGTELKMKQSSKFQYLRCPQCLKAEVE